MTERATPALPASRHGAKRQKVPAFARYKGTSAWKKDRRRVRAHALFVAASKVADAGVSG